MQGKSQKAEIPNTNEAPVVSGAMDPALKAKWVEALRSGEYRQGKVNLESDGKYCCLGVLCKVADQPRTRGGADNYGFVDGVLPSGFSSRLIDMNDCQDRSFAEIADFIEANIPTKENSLAESSS